MQRPLQISYEGMDESAALSAAIQEKAAALDRFHPNVTGCRVWVKHPHRHRQQGHEFEVQITVSVPKDVIVSKQHHEDVYVALRDAFDAARRQLEELDRCMRGEVKPHAGQVQGKPPPGQD